MKNSKILSILVFIVFINTVHAQETKKDSIVNERETSIKEVVISSKKPLIKSKIDGLVYDVQSDPESKSKSLIEMMKKLPYLSIDSNENILFKGNMNFKILINGKETQLLNTNAKEVLKSIPANTIQRIEIITNPSSKYDAEGVSGIINIISTKKMKDGYNASVNFGTKFPKQEQNAGFSLNIQQNKIGISAYGGGFFRNNPEIDYQNNQQALSNYLDQKGRISSKGNGRYFNMNVSYEIDSLHLLNIQVGSNFSKSKSKDLLDSYFYQQDILTENTASSNNSQSKERGFEASVNYQMGFKKDKSQLLTWSYKFNNYDYTLSSISEINNRIENSSSRIDQDNNNQNSENTFQIDFVKNIQKIYLETGLKMILRKNSSAYDAVPENVLNSNEFLNQQNIYGGYFSAKFSVFDWSFQTGLRLEGTETKVNFTSTATGVKQNYFNLIPNISMNKKWKEYHSINFGFSQRIKRPGIIRLNPFINKSNPYFEVSGNPYLKPVVNNDVMLNYSFNKKVNLNVGLSYSFSNKVDIKVSTYDSSTNVTKTTFENSSKISRLGLDYYFNYPVTKKLNLSINGNAAFFLINGIVNDVLVKNNLFTYYLYITANYQFENNWNVNSNLEINSKMPAGLQSTTNGFVGSSFSVSKSILNNQLVFSASINNPFNKFRKSVTETWGEQFYQNNYIRDYYKSFGVSVQYKFGKLKDEIKTTQRKINNNDLSN
ncbi:outer membrane beta-barrel protein [Chryseobacterium polytrichastri]|uniref:Outer membrane receptor proteins, mostly Fe transport n=1 Tax=Chryseobacterium polytrichastri TaxID=1302687 RepID=A0A1M6ZU44_9FLAO|nr:outer membrane beta-barrel protein [Chryseobacterium polytrichastri]SHL33936.1 Outer membrane receptor proteins, mostly Fe transport [Chryseobacterium polytrichastri]